MTNQNSESDMQGTWQIDRRVNIGHVLTTVVIGVSAFWWAANTSQRIAVLESKYIAQEARQERIWSELRSLNEKLDEMTRYLRGRNDALGDRG